MRLVKSPASPIINQLGFRDVGKSGVAFSRPSVGVLVRNEIFKEIWGEVERLDQGISAPRSATGRYFRRLDRQAGRQATAWGPIYKPSGKLESRTPAFLPPDVT